MLKDINPGEEGSSIEYLEKDRTKSPEYEPINGYMLFLADDGFHGREIWTSHVGFDETKGRIKIIAQAEGDESVAEPSDYVFDVAH